MTRPRKKHDFFPYIWVSLAVASLFLLLLLDRRSPIFFSTSGMIPLLFIMLAIAATLARYTMNSPLPRGEDAQKLWLQWHRSGPIGGALTGVIFLGTYWAYDWPAPNRTEISERQVNEICTLSQPVPNEMIIWETPDLAALIPEFMLLGLLLGLVISLIFPRWYTFIHRHTQAAPALRWLATPYPSGLAFGVIFGALIGVWLCPLIFSINDGRPFIRLSTSAISVFLAISFYLLFEITRHRHSMTQATYTTLAVVLFVGALLCSLVWFLDAQLGISTTAYCFFYATWNTELNELKPGWLSTIAGAGYGAMCGAITMSVASGYLIIRTAVEPKKL